MPPRDPRQCPALERALPADARPGPVRFGRTTYDVLFGDGRWRHVTVRARRTDRHGRDVIDIEWHIDAGTWAESYLADPGKMRELAD